VAPHFRKATESRHDGMQRYSEPIMSANLTVLAFGAAEDLFSILLELRHGLKKLANASSRTEARRGRQTWVLSICLVSLGLPLLHWTSPSPCEQSLAIVESSTGSRPYTGSELLQHCSAAISAAKSICSSIVCIMTPTGPRFLGAFGAGFAGRVVFCAWLFCTFGGY
jgi:hypothetical protein